MTKKGLGKTLVLDRTIEALQGTVKNYLRNFKERKDVRKLNVDNITTCTVICTVTLTLKVMFPFWFIMLGKNDEVKCFCLSESQISKGQLQAKTMRCRLCATFWLYCITDNITFLWYLTLSRLNLTCAPIKLTNQGPTKDPRN